MLRLFKIQLTHESALLKYRLFKYAETHTITLYAALSVSK